MHEHEGDENMGENAYVAEWHLDVPSEKNEIMAKKNK